MEFGQWSRGLFREVPCSVSHEARPCGGDPRPSLPCGLAWFPPPVSGTAVCLRPQPPSPSPALPEAAESAVASATGRWTCWAPGDLARLVSRGWGAGVRAGQEARGERGGVRTSRAHLALRRRHHPVSSAAPRPSSHPTSGTGADGSARRPRRPPRSRVRGCPGPPGV